MATRIGLFMAAAVIVASCASGKHPALPVSTDGEPSRGGDYEYVIGPGDVLDIFVWGYPDLSASLPVRPDGRITTRLVEDLEASGRTPTALARDIEREYAEYVKTPVVTVSVDRFVGSANQQVRVVGPGSDPVSVPFEEGMTLLDLVIAIGGLGEHASGNRAVLVRTEAGEEVTYALRLDDLVRRADIEANAPLHPGDIVIVPETWF